MAKVRERVAVNKQRTQTSYGEVQSQDLNKVEGREQYCVEVSNKLAALENLDAEVEINSALEKVGENINISAKESLGYSELRKHKPWLDKECSKL
jgi:hypothetical protein